MKVFPPDRLTPTVLPALPALAEIGLPEIPLPQPALDGSLYQRLGQDVVVVFEHVDGVRVNAATIDLAQVGDLIARVHQQTARVGVPIARETFRWPHAQWWPDALARALVPSSDPAREELRRFFREQAAELADAWAALSNLADACRAEHFDLVLTHGDWPFNLVRSADGSLHLVDWDELVLAPRERDTWFDADAGAFSRGYRGRIDYAPSELTTAYYVHGRYFEDMVGIVLIIFGEHERHPPATAVAALRGDWMTGLRDRAARFRDQR